MNKLELLKNVVAAYNLKMLILGEDEQTVPEFDEGLRRYLYQGYDYTYLIQKIKENCLMGKVYIVCDVFSFSYIIFRLPEEEKTKYVIIGPYFADQDRPDALSIAEKNKLELYQVQTLKDYYYGIITAVNVEQVVNSMLKMMYPENDWGIRRTGISLEEVNDGERYMHQQSSTENEFSMDMIEERYRHENEIMRALAQGDAEKVEKERGKFSGYHFEARTDNNLRNAKNNMLVMNVLFRKAVERAGVHPYYIDKLSTSFGKRIEAARNLVDIREINREIVRRYCLLVKNYSMADYSSVIAKCLNYIDFNLSEELSLNFFAEKFSINASSLSKKFKSETGLTLTDYINQKRVDRSMLLLATTRLPIGEIAAQVGYLNENYYSRIFKKLRGVTPREYREMVEKKE